MRQRLAPLSISLILLVSLALATSPAQAFQLCGPTQFADSVTLSVLLEDPEPQLILSSNWVLSVPNLYDIVGPGTIIQKFTPQQIFVGSGMLGNTSDSFLGNPICRVTPTIVQVSSKPIVFTATAVLLCLAGESGPFQVTLNLILAPCQAPVFPGESSSYQQELLQWPGQEVPLDQRISAGDAANNEYIPR